MKDTCGSLNEEGNEQERDVKMQRHYIRNGWMEVEDNVILNTSTSFTL